jgi:hypothetical protein
MARAVAEWIGATPDTAIPDRVKLRILARQDDRCEGCTRKFDGKLKPVFDHRPALINGGQNRESMIEAVCTTCHAPRTRADVAEKSKVAAIQRKHKLRKETSRGFRRPDGYKHNWRTGRLEKIT